MVKYGILLVEYEGVSKMNLIYKLYDMEYFGVGLIAVILFLIITFIIILFCGKKEEKERKLMETRKLDLQNEIETLKTVEKDNDITKNIPVINQPEIESVIEKSEENTERFEDIVPTSVEEVPSLEEVVEEPILEEIVEYKEDFTKDITSEINSIMNEVVEPKKEETVKMNRTNIPLSSVYAPKTENKEIELPKMAELPKKKEEVSSAKEEMADFDSLFGDISSETYNINK